MRDLHPILLSLVFFGTGNADVTVNCEGKEVEVYTDVTLECDITVSGENESIHDVVWTIDGSDVTSLGKGYSVDEFYDWGNQTTTLTVGTSEIRENTIFTCVVTVSNSVEPIQATSELRFFSITPIDAYINSKLDQTLTCKISGVVEPLNVTWREYDWNEITDGIGGYSISQGSVNNQVQEATLTISAETLEAMELDGYDSFACAAQSLNYPQSPRSEWTTVRVEFLRFGASTLDSHVEINTSAKLLCYAWGLTRQLESVKWEKPAPGGVIIDGTDGYKIDVGTFNKSGDYQESVLTIPASEVTADSTFTCVIQSLEHGIDGERVEANLLVFTVTPFNKKATTNLEHTLTCRIDRMREDLDDPPYFEWDDLSGKVITNDTEGYSVKGVLSAHVQNGSDYDWIPSFHETTLTISPLRLKEVNKQAVNSVVKYSCSAWSSEYEFHASPIRHEVIVTFLTFEIVGKTVEAKADSKSLISCVVKGLTRQLDSVKWEKPAPGGVITDGTDGYKIDVGTYNGGTNSQTTVLTIPSSVVVPEHSTNYTCIIQSNEHGHTATSPVKENVSIVLRSHGEKIYLPSSMLIMCFFFLGSWEF